MMLPKNPNIEPVSLGPLPDRPRVSVIVPSYNQGRFIRATLDSILGQDYRPLCVHVVDGASTDQTVDVLRSYGDIPELQWRSESDSGVVEAVNKGFSQVDGDVIAIQSSDDMYLPGALSTMVAALQARPDHGLIYADMETVDAEGQFLFRSEIRPFSLRSFLNKQTWIPQPTAFFRREMLKACGGWDNRYFSADTQLWLRMAFRTKVAKIDACIAQRRRHETQRNHQIKVIADAYRRMVRESPELQQADRTLRRAATAGTHIHAIRYNASGSKLIESYHLWRALAADRSLWASYRSSPLLVPGWLPLRILISRLKNGGQKSEKRGQKY